MELSGNFNNDFADQLIVNRRAMRDQTKKDFETQRRGERREGVRTRTLRICDSTRAMGDSEIERTASLLIPASFGRRLPSDIEFKWPNQGLSVARLVSGRRRSICLVLQIALHGCGRRAQTIHDI